MSQFRKKIGRVNTLYIFFPSYKQNMQNKIKNGHQNEMYVNLSHNCQTNKWFFPR